MTVESVSVTEKPENTDGNAEHWMVDNPVPSSTY
eukprot:COSAG02_NODE_43280_length_376_cov_0.844765_1_plen_33_part_10